MVRQKFGATRGGPGGHPEFPMVTGILMEADQIPPPRPPDGGALEAHEGPPLPAPARSACEPHRTFIEEQVRLSRNATAIYQDLVDRSGFIHKYNSVKRFRRWLSKSEPEQFDRLEFQPGEEAQLDYGEGYNVVLPPISPVRVICDTPTHKFLHTRLSEGGPGGCPKSHESFRPGTDSFGSIEHRVVELQVARNDLGRSSHGESTVTRHFPFRAATAKGTRKFPLR